MRKKQPFGLASEKSSQRAPHLFFVPAIFPGEKREPQRLKVNQRVANNERAAIRRMIKRYLAGHGAIDGNYLQLIANFCAIGDFCEPRRLLASKTLTLRQDRD